MTNRQTVEPYLVAYLEKKGIKTRKSGSVTMVQCPYCKTDPMTATIPPHNNFVTCYKCKTGKKFIFDLVTDLDGIANTEEEQIHFIKEYLNLSLVTKKDKDQIEEALEFYQSNGFDLVPVATICPDCHGKKETTCPKCDSTGNYGKNPVESAWTSKNHKDKKEWQNWLDTNLNLGIKTGQISNITVLDFDTNEIPNEIKALLGETFQQKTKKGCHYYYTYEDIPNTSVRELKLDIQNTGAQVVAFPSHVCGVQRKIPKFVPIIAMPPELRKYLDSKITVPLKSFSEKIKDDIETGDFTVNLLEEGQRNAGLIKLGGILRQEFSVQQTETILSILNRHACSRQLPQSEIRTISKSLGKYMKNDAEELAHRVLTYLRDVDEAGRNEISSAIVGTTRGEDKMRVDKALKFLTKERYILKKGAKYKILRKMEWATNLISEETNALPYKIPYFDDIHNFEPGDLLLIGAKTKVGKCFIKGTKILMSDGTSKAVEQIQKGEQVQGIKNQKRKVLETCIGYGKLYQISSTKQVPFVVNGEHILCLVNSTTNEKITMSVNKYLKKNKTFKNHWKLYAEPVNWPTQKLPVDPYFLGLWLGDGDATNTRITTKDQEIVTYLDSYAKQQDWQVSTYKYKQKCPSYAITRKKQNRTEELKHTSLLFSLKQLNVIRNKHIPRLYKINNKNHRLQLLAGLIDSDGYLNYKGNIEFSFVNPTLAKDIIFLARSLGFSARMKKNKAMFNTWRYRFQIVGDTTIIPTKLPRKQSKKPISIKNPLYSGFKIKELTEDNYYGFVLDGDHLFLLESFIVNHNTHLSLNIIKRLVTQGITPYYLSLESGSRFKKISLQLGLKEGDFYYNKEWIDPMTIELEKNSIMILDWLCPQNFAEVDKIFLHFTEQLHKTHSTLIVFMQLKQTGDWFSPNLVTQFPAFAVKFEYDDPQDRTYSKFKVVHQRDSKLNTQVWEIPMKYNFETKELNTLAEIQEQKPKIEETKPEKPAAGPDMDVEQTSN